MQFIVGLRNWPGFSAGNQETMMKRPFTARLFAFLVAALFVSVVVAASYLRAEDTAPRSGERWEKDSAGREWLLLDWQDGSRPYPKSLKEREAWYRKKWGENWYGPGNGCRIHNPGEWRWDVVDTVPADMAARIKGAKGGTWGDQYDIMAFVWAPGGEQVTDVYATSDNCFYHYDPRSRQRTFIGDPAKGGATDGAMGHATLQPGVAVTLDPVTGRLYFLQGKTLRYVEKLLPYQCAKTGKTCYLPAVLDWHDIYRKVRSPFGGDLEPIIKDGKRAGAVFVVRSGPTSKELYLPGPHRGRRLLLTQDGKGVYISPVWAPETSTNYENTVLMELDGEVTGKLKLTGTVPPNWREGTDGPGTHGGNCVGYDGKIYTAQHGGCCGPCGSVPGRMFSIDPRTGQVTMLYNSVPADGGWKKERGTVVDGPADAASLKFTSTLWQVQCPRTGAIINGGWDNSGIRRYHDGFVTSIVSGAETYGMPPRPGWERSGSPIFYHRNCNPSVAPNGDLYIADVKSRMPRIIRIYRTDWPKEQPVNGYAGKFMPKEKLEALMLEYAKKYIENYGENDRIVKGEK
jgi:hypothetical protein